MGSRAVSAKRRAADSVGTVAEELCESVGMSGEEIEAMYRLLAIAKYDERYVVPAACGSSPGCGWSTARVREGLLEGL